MIVISIFIGKDSDMGKIDSLTITPDPPVKGQDITVKATFTLSKQHYILIMNDICFSGTNH